MNLLRFAPSVLLVILACASQPAASSQKADPWAKTFEPPRALDTARVHLEPLGPEHTPLDYAAFMSSIDHLHRTLHWGKWPPPDFTLEDNQKDLVHHRKEFDEREAYAFTVQSTDRTRCVGCIYIDPISDDDRAPGTTPEHNAAMLAFWVIESELGSNLDRNLLTSVLDWLHRDWPFTTIYVPLHVENERGIAIARELGLLETTAISMEHHVVFRG